MSQTISQQTNTWCILAGFCSEKESEELARNVFGKNNLDIVRNGPYFWSYALPILARLGMHRTAIDVIRNNWTPMIQNGATTLWETFSGDELDSWCHPWSAAPLEFLLKHILGLDVMTEHTLNFKLRPRFDILNEANGAIMSPAGKINIAWKRNNKSQVEVSGEVPNGAKVDIFSPEGELLGSVSGKWKLSTSK